MKVMLFRYKRYIVKIIRPVNSVDKIANVMTIARSDQLCR